MTHLLEPKQKLDGAREPAKRWVNWYRALEDCNNCCGPGTRAGTVYADVCAPCGHDPYPSKDIAESEALRDEAEDLAAYGRLINQYLGAFPVGERP